MTSTYKTTRSTHAVSNAFRQHGFTLASDGAPEYQNVKNDRVQVWVKEVDAEREIRFHVTFNRDGHVTSYGSPAGYAQIHGEGRQGGVWRPSFTSKQCRELLLSNLADMFDGEREYLVSRAAQPKR